MDVSAARFVLVELDANDHVVAVVGTFGTMTRASQEAVPWIADGRRYAVKPLVDKADYGRDLRKGVHMQAESGDFNITRKG